MVPSNAYEQLKTSGAGTLYYGLNTTVVSQIVSNLKGPLGDPEVRQALLMATDREGIIKAGEAGRRRDLRRARLQEHVGRPVRRDEVDSIYDELPTYDYDVDAAKELGRRGRRRRPEDRHRDQPDLASPPT